MELLPSKKKLTRNPDKHYGNDLLFQLSQINYTALKDSGIPFEP